MRITAHTLLTTPIAATDGDIGRVGDLLLEDDTHAIRWIVADTGGWMAAHETLLPPVACRPDDSLGRLNTDLTSEQVRTCPPASADRPVGRAYEKMLFEHYRIGPYWSLAPGGGMLPPPAPTDAGMPGHEEAERAEAVHLRSVRELLGYHIEATDDTAGHIADLVFDADDWHLRFVVGNTRNWLPGGRDVVLAPDWFEHFDYLGKRGIVRYPSAIIADAPAFDAEHLNADYAAALEAHLAGDGDDARR